MGIQQLLLAGEPKFSVTMTFDENGLGDLASIGTFYPDCNFLDPANCVVWHAGLGSGAFTNEPSSPAAMINAGVNPYVEIQTDRAGHAFKTIAFSYVDPSPNDLKIQLYNGGGGLMYDSGFLTASADFHTWKTFTHTEGSSFAKIRVYGTPNNWAIDNLTLTT